MYTYIIIINQGTIIYMYIKCIILYYNKSSNVNDITLHAINNKNATKDPKKIN